MPPPLTPAQIAAQIAEQNLREKKIEEQIKEQERNARLRVLAQRSVDEQDYTIRFRDDGLIQKLFLPSTNKLEADNMNRLFSSI
jgi:hypothetical protein